MESTNTQPAPEENQPVPDAYHPEQGDILVNPNEITTEETVPDAYHPEQGDILVNPNEATETTVAVEADPAAVVEQLPHTGLEGTLGILGTSAIALGGIAVRAQRWLEKKGR